MKLSEEEMGEIYKVLNGVKMSLCSIIEGANRIEQIISAHEQGAMKQNNIETAREYLIGKGHGKNEGFDFVATVCVGYSASLQEAGSGLTDEEIYDEARARYDGTKEHDMLRSLRFIDGAKWARSILTKTK